MRNATNAEERQDWTRYRATGDVDARNRLVERHVRLVYYLAHRLSRRPDGLVERSDLVSAGVMGLMMAVSAYDPDRGHRFSTFAAVRIRGAMLDELRRRDVAPRSVRRRQRAMERAGDRLTVELDRRPRHPELAGVLGVDAKTLWRWKWDVSRSRSVSLEDVLSPASPSRDPSGGLAAAATVEDRLVREEEVARLRRELATLTERERLVIQLYDMESQTLRQIAARLGVTESRVSQIRTAALRRLRGQMQDLREAA